MTDDSMNGYHKQVTFNYNYSMYNVHTMCVRDASGEQNKIERNHLLTGVLSWFCYA